MPITEIELTCPKCRGPEHEGHCDTAGAHVGGRPGETKARSEVKVQVGYNARRKAVTLTRSDGRTWTIHEDTAGDMADDILDALGVPE
jgi:hypothetical protein